GMGEVHRAYDTNHARMVALKRLPLHLSEDETFQARFRHEAEVAARLTEPHVIPIHRYGEINGQLFLDMRLVEGVDLQTVIAENGKLDVRRAVSIIGQVASALDAAHRAGLVHRDVKPSNILITRDSESIGAEEFAYLIDFGIASGLQSPRFTNVGQLVGS